MKIKLISGATAYEATKNTLKYVDLKDFDKENLIVVPDAFSMQAESLLFDVLDEKATFNTEVVGISRLASKILKKHNIAYDRISGLEEIFCIFKALKEEEKNFKYFKRCSVDYSIKILQIIKQFKACRILPRQISEVGDALLDNKMHDLKLIYEKYEALLEEKLDLSRLLNYFVEKVESLDLSRVNLFFVNFDSFSMEINSFICKLAKYVNRIYIGYAKPLSQNNAFIYEEDILKKTKAYAIENGVNVEVVGEKSSLVGHKAKIAKEIFGFNITREQNDFFVNLVGKNKKDEVEFVAKLIRKEIVEGAKFKNFSVAVADKSYYEIVKDVFSKFKIAFYCDDADNLSKTILGDFLLKTLQIAKVGFLQESLQYFASSPLLNSTANEECLFAIKYFNIRDEKEFLERFKKYEKIIKLNKKLKKNQKISDFCQILTEIMQYCKENYEKLILSLKKVDAKKFAENQQTFALIEKVCEKLSLLGGDEEFALVDFESLFQTALESVKVETIPTYIDAVFVGDATDSYFQDVDSLFVLGATANSLPKSRADVGILDDDDLEKLSLKIRIEPEIKVINRRNRLKIFELLQHAERKLYVSYPLKDGEQILQRSSVVDDLCAMFGENILQSNAIEIFKSEDKEEGLANLLLFIGTNSNLLDAYSYLKGKGCELQDFEGPIKDLISQTIPTENKFDIFAMTENSQKLFDLKKVSPSQLESYFRCPFVHFVKYLLKIKEFQNVEPTKLQFGSIMHALLEKYFSNSSYQNVDESEFVGNFIDENGKEFYDGKIINRKYFVDFLKKEGELILKNAKKEQKISDFSPKMLEEKIFEDVFDGIKLSGVVDRVDVSDNYFRILDYKTGETQNLKKELFYGKKLQLFLYANCIKEKTGLDLAGVFYFDCQTKFSKVGERKTLFNGLILKDEKAILKTDYRIEEDGFKSDIISVSKTKPSKKNPFGYRGVTMVENFDDLLSYAKELSTKALEEIKKGYVSAKPLEGACKWCAFNSICKHRPCDGERKMLSVKEEDLKRKKL